MRLSPVITTFTIYLLSVTISTSILAQSKKDSTALDYSHPGKYHQLLANLVGEWKFKGKRFSGNPNPDSNKVVLEYGGRIVRRAVMNGRFFVVDLAGGKLQIPVQDGKLVEDTVRDMTTEGYDNVKQKFVQAFINNHIGTHIVFWEGTYDPASNTINYVTEVEGPPGVKRKRYQRFILHDINHYTVEYFWEQDGKKVKTNESDCVRVRGN